MTERSSSTPGPLDAGPSTRGARLERHPTLLGVAPAAPIVIGHPERSSPSLRGPASSQAPGSDGQAQPAPASETRPRTPAPAPVPLLGPRIDTPPKHTFEAIALGEDDAPPRRRRWVIPTIVGASVGIAIAVLAWRLTIHPAPAPSVAAPSPLTASSAIPTAAPSTASTLDATPSPTTSEAATPKAHAPKRGHTKARPPHKAKKKSAPASR